MKFPVSTFRHFFLRASALLLLTSGIAQAQTVYTVGSSGQFGRFDLTTRAYTQISGTAFNGLDTTALGWQSTTSTMYVSARGGTSTIRTVNSSTGALGTAVNYTWGSGAGPDHMGLTFNSSGTGYTYNYGNDAIHSLANPATGATTQLSAVAVMTGDAPLIGRLAFVGSTLYGTMKVTPSTSAGLHSFSTSNGAVTFLGNGGAGATYDSMVAFSSGSTLYGIAGTTLYSINTSNGALTTVGTITGASLPTSFAGAVVGPAAPPDYTITTSGGVMTITDTAGNGDTLSLTEPAVGSISFAAAGRTFSLNGAATTSGSSGNISLSGITSVVVNAGGGADDVRVNAFTTAGGFPALTVNGGTGNDIISLRGNITFAANANLNVDLQNDDASPGTDNITTDGDLSLSGTGGIVFKASRQVAIYSNLTTVDGGILIDANTQLPKSTGDFDGVFIDTGIIRTLGSGSISISGVGGDSSSAWNSGIHMQSAAQISTAAGNIALTGTGGGSGTVSDNVGVSVIAGTSVAAGGSGTLTIIGTGGQSTGSTNEGVLIRSTVSTAGGALSISGTGGTGTGNRGVRITDSGASVTSGGGTLSITGSSSVGEAIFISSSASVNSGGGDVTLTADTISLATTVTVNAGAGTTLLKPQNAGTPINLGGSDVLTGSPKTLGLSDTELDRITTGTLRIGDTFVGDVTITGLITRPATTDMEIIGDADIAFTTGSINTGGGFLNMDASSGTGTIKPDTTGVDATGSEVGGAGNMSFNITGTTVDTQYEQLKVVGGVSISDLELTLTGSYVPVAGNSFTLIDNDGTDAVSGVFVGKPQGSTVVFNGVSLTLSYTGGTGNDVTLTAPVVNAAPTDIALTNSSVAENAGADATVGTLSSTDTDAGQTHTYSLVAGVGSTDNAAFNISGSTLRLTASADFETKSSYSVRIQTDDGNGGSYTEAFTITVTNVNELPSFTKGADQTVPAGTNSAQSVSGWATTIEDGDSTVTQALTFNVTNNNNALFTTQPAIASNGTLTFTPTGTPGTATVSVTLTDDASINGTAALTTAAQSFTITVAAAADYSITTAAGVMTITDNAGNADTLIMNVPVADLVIFSATGRTFSLNGAASTNDQSSYISLAGITSIIVNAAAGADTINIGPTASPLPSLTLNGGIGNDTISLTGDITFATNASLDADLQNDDATPGVDQLTVTTNSNVITSGTGTITVKVSRSISLSTGSSLETVNGNLTLEANQQSSPTADNFTGVLVNGTVQSTGTGTVTIKGKGGTSNSNYGVFVSNGIIRGGIAGTTLRVEGKGTLNGVSNHRAVSVSGSTAAITSNGGDVEVIGNGGGATAASFCYGVDVRSSSRITAGGSGNVTVTGTGGSGTGGVHLGIHVLSAGQITSNDGHVTVTGTGGSGGNSLGVSFNGGAMSAGGSGNLTITGTGSGNGGGVAMNTLSGNRASVSTGELKITGVAGSTTGLGFEMLTGAVIDTSTSNRPITIEADTMGLAGTTFSAGSGLVTLRPVTAGKLIEIGVADSASTLGLTETELDSITAGALTIGSSAAGSLAVSEALTRPASTNVALLSGGSITLNSSIDTAGGTLLLDSGDSPAIIAPKASGTDVTASTLSFGSTLSFAITSATVYDSLVVAGAVDITGHTLQLTGSYVPVAGNTFTLIDNDGTDAITGTFAGLAQGATVIFNGVPHTLSYTGGTGNDVVLSAPAPVPEINVQGNSLDIANGDITPVTTDGTRFQNTVVGFNSTRVFTIQNLGTATLSVSAITFSGTNATDFSLETAPPYSIVASGSQNVTVRFTPSGLGSRTATLSIASNDSDEATYTYDILGVGSNVAPTDISLTATTLAENNAANATVGTLSTTDGNPGDTHTYVLAFGTGDTDNAAFDISGNALTFTGSANFEAKSSYSIRIQTSDGNGGFYAEVFTITITNENELPSFTKGADQTLPNGINTMQTLNGWATAIDDGDSTVTQALTFNITGNTNNALFTTQPAIANDGTLTFTPTGAAGTATVSVTLTDDATINGTAALTTTAQTFTITVAPSAEIDVRGNSISIASGDTTPSITDNTDFGSTNTVGGSSGRSFSIHNTGGSTLSLTGTPVVAISGTHAADFTIAAQPAATVSPSDNVAFSINFSASDIGLRTATVTISSSDADEPSYTFAIQGTGEAPQIALEGNSVAIAQNDTTPALADHTDFGGVAVAGSATVVRTFTVRNTGNASLSSIVASVTGTHASDFSITTAPADTVTAGSSTTFSVTFDPSAKDLRNAAIRVTSSDPDDSPFTFAIQGTGQNSAPTDITLSNSTISENNAAGAIVGGASVVDADPGDIGPANLSLALVAGAGDTDNASFTTALGELLLTPSADFETKSSYNVRLQVSDGTDSYSEAFTIMITNVNELPSFTKGGNQSHPALTNTAQTVSDWATAIDDGDSTVIQALSFTVTNDTNTLFTTQPAISSSGELTYTPNGTPGTAIVSVTLTDDASINGNPALTTTAQTFTITVATAPEINITGNAATIASGDITPSTTDHTDFGSVATASGTIVRTFTVQNTGTATLSITSTGLSGTHAADFTVTTAPAANVTAASSTTFQVTFNPSANGLRTATLTIVNNDADENPYTFAIQGTGTNSAPTDIALSNASVAENAGTNASVGTLSSTDIDTADTHSYSLVAGAGDTDNAAFNLSGSTLRLTASANFEAKSSYSVRVQTDDGQGGTYSEAFTITITNVNENPSFTKGSSRSHPAGTTTAQTIPGWATGIDDGDSTVTQTLTFSAPTSNDTLFTVLPSVALDGTLTYTLTGAPGVAIVTVNLRDDSTLGAPVRTFVDTFTITVSNTPTVNLSLSDSALKIGDTATVTFTFSEAVSGFTTADLTVPNGSIPTVSSSDGGITFTGIYTPNANIEDSTNIISVDQIGFTSVATTFAGVGSSSSANFTIDTKRPEASIIVADSALTVGETSLVTVTFNEAVTGFTTADLSVPNGSIPTVSSGDGGSTWTGTFTPTAGIADATNIISLDNTGVSDTAGNAGAGTTDSANFTIDTTAPEMDVRGNAISIASGDSTPTTADGTDFSNVLLASQQAKTYTVFNTGTANLTGGVVTFTGTHASDFSLQQSPTFPITPGQASSFVVLFRPGAVGLRTATINIASNDANENPYTFAIQGTGTNSAPTDIGLTNSSVAENAGANVTIGSLSSTDANTADTHSYSLVAGTGDTDNAAFNISGSSLRLTASADFETKSSYSIRVQTNDGNGGTYAKAFTISITDVNEVPSFTKGADRSHPVGTNTAQSVTGWATGIDDGDSTVEQTLSFNITGNTNSALFTTQPAISSTGTLTFTPTGSAGSATISVTLTDDASINGNAALTTAVQTFTITLSDTPTVNISLSDSALKIGETATVTFTFSEAVTGFTTADLTVPNGSIPSVSTSDGGSTFTGIFTPTTNTEDATNVITVDQTGVTSISTGFAGVGTGSSANFSIDTKHPTVSIVVSDTTLTFGETSLVTFTFSEAVTNFTTADLLVDNGSITSLSSSDGGLTWTGTLTPAVTIEATNVITLDITGVDDLAGNSGSGSTDSNNYAIGNIQMSIEATDATADENTAGTGTYRITRNTTSGSTTVQLVIDASSTASATDWTQTGASFASLAPGSTGSIVIPDGQSFAEITLTPTGDIRAEAAETVRLSLVADAAYTLGEPRTDTVTISQNDFVVTNTNDAGEGTLRQALANADAIAGTDTITFDATAFATPQTITLSSGEISSSSDFTLTGPAAQLTVSGGNASSILQLFTGSEVSISGIHFTQGRARIGRTGGAIDARVPLTLTDCRFTNNTGDEGGAVASHTNLTVRRCTFSGNTAVEDGGALSIGDDEARIFDSTFTNNLSNDEGGAIDNSADLCYMVNCTISGNNAKTAGGGINNQGPLTLIHCTVTGNRADSDGAPTYPPSADEGIAGGGIRTDDERGTVTLYNSIVAGNFRGTGTTPADLSPAVIGQTGVLAASANNIIGDPASSAELVNGVNNNIVGKVGAVWPIAEILNTTLADNGGATQTHALLNGSPAVNAGSTAYSVNPVDGIIGNGDDIPLTTEQRGTGYPRLISTAPDMGAYEHTDTRPNLELIAGGPFKLNFSTGLLEQRITVTNRGETPLIGFRLRLTNLPTGYRLWNATHATLPIKDFALTLSPGASTVVTIEIYSPTRTVAASWTPLYELKGFAYVSLDPTNTSIPAAGGTYSITIQTLGSWSSVETLPWVSLSSTEGDANSTITVIVLANNSLTPRTGSIRVGNATHTLSQAAATRPIIGPLATSYPAIISGAFSLTVPVTRPVTSFTAGGLPPGLSFNASTGLISGTPTRVGSYIVRFAAINAAGTATAVSTLIQVQPIPTALLGSYDGLIERSKTLFLGSVPVLAGRIQFNITATGGFTGRVTYGSSVTPISSSIQTSVSSPGEAVALVPIPGTRYQLQLVLRSASHSLVGALTHLDRAEHAHLIGYRNRWSATTPATEYAALHNVLLNAPTLLSADPQGHSFVSYKPNAPSGSVRLQGHLADGSTITTTTFLGPNGEVLLHTPLYSGKGDVSAFLLSTTNAAGPNDNRIRAEDGAWLKLASPTSTSYRAGFDIALEAEGGIYLPPPPGRPIMGLSIVTTPNVNAQLTFEEGGLVTPITQTFTVSSPTLSTASTAIFPPYNPNRITLAINPTTGALTGTFRDGTRTADYKALIIPTTTGPAGLGYFLLPQATGTPLSGWLELAP